MFIPSVDLSCGKAVQLRQGREKVLERDDPLVLAKEFSKFGEVSVIDLDAAFGKGSNDLLVKEICRIGECRVGGGIRTVERAQEVISWGAEKVIIGTGAFKNRAVNHDFLKDLNSALGKNRVMIALDSLQDEIVIEGWRSKTGLHFSSVVKEIEAFASEILFTSVENEGLMKGANFDAIEKLRRATDLSITAAGGISTLEEIESLSKLGVNVQIGMALYTGKIGLPEAFIASLQWANELIPTIAVDGASQVLMLAWSSRESLERTLKTGNIWYYSRSRGKLWMKGESSGNVQRLEKIRTDCDGDALLLTVGQNGCACHVGRYSCFGNKVFSLHELYEAVKQRIENPSPLSYTSGLTRQMVGEKIREEAQELCEAEKREDMIWEAADLLYFITVHLAQEGISPAEVFHELKRRRRSPKRNSVERI